MDAEPLDLSSRLTRSLGRAGRTKMANARVTDKECWELHRAAKTAGQTLSEWSREVLLREARRTNGDAVFTEGIATRLLMLELLRPLLKQAGVGNEQISEVMAGVREAKHRTAREVMKQYTRDGEA